MALESLKSYLAEIANLSYVSSLVDWDQQTQMPPGSANARAEHLATMSKVIHEKQTSDELGKLIEESEKAINGKADDDLDTILVRKAREDFDKAVKLPVAFVADFERLTALAHHSWAKARAESDFSLFRDDLAKIFEKTAQMADYLGYEDHLYDALLDQYEPGMKSAEVTRIFNELRGELVPLVAAIAANQDRVKDDVVHQAFPEDLQRKTGLMAAEAIGFDFHHGRLDTAVHPFATNFSCSDVRITTRYDLNWFNPAFFGIMHEAGHGMYEQGSAPELDLTPLAGGTSLGIHESQSRLWENVVGRSKNFWQYFYPKLQEVYPEQFGGVDLDTFYRAINLSEPSLIRVEADEVTYSLHVMIRYDLERAVYDGTVKIDDIPAAWNARYEDYLGVTPPNDKEGCLQDVHWSMGIMGYFPTYALGNLLSVQFFDKAVEAHPSIPQEISEGKFGTLLTWLQTNIYQHGSKYKPQELVKRVTGDVIRTEPLMKYLNAKFGDIYGL